MASRTRLAMLYLDEHPEESQAAVCRRFGIKPSGLSKALRERIERAPLTCPTCKQYIRESFRLPDGAPDEE